MNRLFITFLILISFYGHFSEASDGFLIKLNYKTKIGYENGYDLKSNSDGIFLNGILLNSQKLILNEKKIIYLLNSKREIKSEAQCVAGKYQYSVSFKKNYDETGCIDDERFNHLFKVFQSF